VASSPKLLDRVRWHLRVKHYSIRTEQAYVDWIRRYILFHRKRHPNEMGEKEITDFLTHLAVEKSVAASTQNQAFAALLFLYQQVLDRKLDFIDKVERVTRPAKLPVFTPNEARSVLAYLKGDYRLMAELLYGSGLRHSVSQVQRIATFGLRWRWASRLDWRSHSLRVVTTRPIPLATYRSGRG
jgi:site-specific recombinase XerD